MSSEPTASSSEQADTIALARPLHLEVIFDKEADKKFVRLICGDANRHNLGIFWMRNLIGYAGLVLGIYSSFMSGLVFIGCIISTLGVWLFKQHRVVATAIAETGASVTDPIRVSVLITEKGVIETIDGIEARFDWSAMRHWILAEDILCIKLANERWAWLPARGMEPAIRLEDLAGLLTSKGVLERPLQSRAA